LILTFSIIDNLSIFVNWSFSADHLSSFVSFFKLIYKEMKNKFLLFVITCLIVHCTLNIENCMCQWVRCNGVYGSFVNSLANSGNSIFAGTSMGVNLSTNNGLSWIYSSLNNSGVRSLAVSGNDIYAGTSYKGVYVSTNTGTSWNPTSLTNENISALAVSENNLLAGITMDIFGKIMKTTNNGLNWIVGSWGYVIINSLVANENKIFAGTIDSGVFYSTNNGTNWIQTALNNQYVLSLAVNGNDVYAGTLDSGIFKSTNNGFSWAQTALNNKRVHSIAVSGNNIFAGTLYNGVFVSTNSGTSWIQKNEGFWTNPIVRVLLIANNYVFAGIDNDTLWRRPLSELINDVNNNNSETPASFSLSQNYPNPFNPTTNIKYQIARHGGSSTSFITLKIFDILGKEVATLVNEKQSAGTYEVSFGGSNLATGFYFYSLYVDGYRFDTKRMILLK